MRSIKTFANKCIKAIDPSYSIVWRQYGAGKGITYPEGTYTWDGTGVLRMSEYNELRAIHDIAHIMLASKKRRKMPEFGLGPDPSGDYSDKQTFSVAVKNPLDEELKACDLHWAMGAYLRGKKGALEVMEYVCIEISNIPNKQQIQRMARHKGLPKNFVPTVLKVRKQIVD